MGKENTEKSRYQIWYQNNRDRRRATIKAYYEKNRERVNEQKRRKRLEEKEADPDGLRLKDKLRRIAYEERRERMAADSDRPLGLPAPRR